MGPSIIQKWGMNSFLVESGFKYVQFHQQQDSHSVLSSNDITINEIKAINQSL